MKMLKHKKFQENRWDWLPTFPKSGWDDMEWPYGNFHKVKNYLNQKQQIKQSFTFVTGNFSSIWRLPYKGRVHQVNDLSL